MGVGWGTGGEGMRGLWGLVEGGEGRGGEGRVETLKLSHLKKKKKSFPQSFSH